MRIAVLSTGLMVTIAACGTQAPQPQNENVVNVTVTDQAAPPGALGNMSVNYSQGNITPGEQGNIHATEQQKPEQAVVQFARDLSNKRFADAFERIDSDAMGVSEKQFEQRFADYKTIDAAVGKIGRTEGAAGSLYSDVQLTLSGNRNDGSPYVVTGPVTLRRVNDVPGSTAEQRRWHIVKMELTANAQAAEALVNHQK